MRGASASCSKRFPPALAARVTVRNLRADHRHRRRQRLRRAGAGDPRHAGHQQGFLAALPAPLCRPVRPSMSDAVSAVYRGREGSAISPTGRSSTDPAGCAARRDGIISIPDPEAGDFSCPGSRRRDDAPDCCPGIPGAGRPLRLVRDCAGGFPARGAGGCPGRRRVYLPVAGPAGRCPGGSDFARTRRL